jgi:hypothetical protein
VVAANQAAADAPESVNQDAYAAWLFKLKPDNAADLDGLLDAAAYAKVPPPRHPATTGRHHGCTRLPRLAGALEQRDEFIARHIGPDAGETAAMLARSAHASLDELIGQTVPAAIRLAQPLPLAGPAARARGAGEAEGHRQRRTSSGNRSSAWATTTR